MKVLHKILNNGGRRYERTTTDSSTTVEEDTIESSGKDRINYVNDPSKHCNLSAIINESRDVEVKKVWDDLEIAPYRKRIEKGVNVGEQPTQDGIVIDLINKVKSACLKA